MTLKALKER